MELITLRLVKPATLELTRLSEIGTLTAKTVLSTSPVSRPAWLSSFQTRIMPTVDTAVLKIIMSTRVDGT